MLRKTIFVGDPTELLTELVKVCDQNEVVYTHIAYALRKKEDPKTLASLVAAVKTTKGLYPRELR